MSRFLYFYTMRNAPELIRKIVAAHVAYWQDRNLPEYIGGPFGDRSGGLITFAAASLASARETAQNDPFVQAGLIENSWVKEWHVE